MHFPYSREVKSIREGKRDAFKSTNLQFEILILFFGQKAEDRAAVFACPDQHLNLRVPGWEREGQLKVYVTPSIKWILWDLCETQMCSSNLVLKKRMHKHWKNALWEYHRMFRLCYIKKLYKFITLLNAICAKIWCVWKFCLGANTIPPTQSNSKIFTVTHTQTSTSIQSSSLAMIYLLYLSLSHLPLVKIDMAWKLRDNYWVITLFTLMPAVPRCALTAEGTPLAVAAAPGPAGGKAHVHTATVRHQASWSTARRVGWWT